MAINVEKDKPQNRLKNIFSDNNVVVRGLKDLTAMFWDVAAAPINMNIALLKVGANSNLPGAAIPAALAPAAVMLALTVPHGLATVAMTYGIVSAVTNVLCNFIAFSEAVGNREAKPVYQCIYPNTVKRIDVNKQRKLAA
jgi:hypothetical protein